MFGGRSSLLRLVRRGIALLALLSILTPLELLVPDAHDGDAVAAALDQPAASVLAPGQHQNVPLPTPDHRTHVDHCSHAHLLTVVSREQALGPGGPYADQLFDTAAPWLESVSAAPHQRPPIA